MNNEQKITVAKSLYLGGYTHADIAESVNATRKTIGAWVKKYKWDVIRAANDSTKPEVIANLYLNIAEIQEKARNEERPITNAESDQIIKISNSIAKLQGKTTLQTYIEIFKEYNSFLSENNPKLLKPNNLSQRDFIQSKVNDYH